MKRIVTLHVRSHYLLTRLTATAHDACMFRRRHGYPLFEIDNLQAYHSIFLGDTGVQVIGKIHLILSLPSNLTMTSKAIFPFFRFGRRHEDQPTLFLHFRHQSLHLMSIQTRNRTTFLTKRCPSSAPIHSFATLKSKVLRIDYSFTAFFLSRNA